MMSEGLSKIAEDALAAVRGGAGITTGQADIRHRDGISWINASVPRRLHRCWVQTEGVLGGPLGDLYQRCPCGAVRRNNGYWMDRNARRKRR